MNPQHIAVIPDGNGRWARLKGLSRIEGHKEGINRVKEIIDASIEFELKALTIYVFSKENWKRPKSEVNALMDLLTFYLNTEMNKLAKRDIQFKAIGEIGMFSSRLQNLIEKFETLTQNNKGLILTCALSYSGRYEIIDAIKKIIRSGIDSETLTEETFAQYLYTAGLADPDLIIRTSGEKRLSNYLLWQSAYSEFYFTDVMWPDFTKKELLRAIEEYKHRDRRYGDIHDDL